MSKKRKRKKTQVNFVNKNAGLKERSASKTAVAPEEAEPYPWLEGQVPEDSGKLSLASNRMCLGCQLSSSQSPESCLSHNLCHNVHGT